MLNTMALNFSPVTSKMVPVVTERHREKLYPVSLVPASTRSGVKAPALNNYNPPAEQYNKLSCYLGKLDRRLSKPKMTSKSPDRTPQPVAREHLQIKKSLTASKTGYPAQRQTSVSIERLQPTEPSPLPHTLLNNMSS